MKLVEVVRSVRAARVLVVDAYERARQLHEDGKDTSYPCDFGFDLDDSAVRRRFFSGRERLKGVFASTGE